ncbi:nucleoside phosphatase, putative,guanosine diphosphatase, putative [Trypanosoma cruzi marinkellei]|uniref:Nucleoside phosphatase, putative,guanosine diphosphatase, putative n=1 Tax=Trypanosoma cruzi marinkellei TaxID=85056 RepID=K2MIV0_TRYCR|nr:nucleoside phosphatase, putative,guanosine diphosphatase, putative [Trypanosoma cruzi marinkellei]
MYVVMGAAMKQSMARSRQLRRPSISLTFTLLCLFLVTVVYITAYTVGKFSMDARGREKLELTDRIIHSITRRFQECQAQKQLLNNGQATAGMALEIAQETKKKLEMELGLLRNRNTLILQSVEECKKELELLKENGHGAVTLTLQLDRLTKERQLYMDAIAVVNRSSDVGRRQTADVFAAIARELGEWEDAAQKKTELLTNCNNAMRRYSIVIDAGSTGSRVHVFRYNLTSNPHAGNFSWNGTRLSLMPFLRLDDELFVENYEPLSKLNNPNDAVASLSPLLEAAKAYIPESLHACVPIELKATAGLRRIGRERAEAVLNVVRRFFARGPFWMQSELDSVRILEGWEEGPLAWLTVNYLRGALNGDNNTATILDLGGGSTQIVMYPTDPKALDAYAEFSYALKVNGRSFVVYQHSYEGNGLHAAKEQLLQAVAANIKAQAGKKLLQKQIRIPVLLLTFPWMRSRVSQKDTFTRKQAFLIRRMVVKCHRWRNARRSSAVMSFEDINRAVVLPVDLMVSFNRIFQPCQWPLCMPFPFTTIA